MDWHKSLPLMSMRLDQTTMAEGPRLTTYLLVGLNPLYNQATELELLELDQVHIHVSSLPAMTAASSLHYCSKSAVICPYSYQFRAPFSREGTSMGNICPNSKQHAPQHRDQQGGIKTESTRNPSIYACNDEQARRG